MSEVNLGYMVSSGSPGVTQFWCLKNKLKNLIFFEISIYNFNDNVMLLKNQFFLNVVKLHYHIIHFYIYIYLYI